jgi:hypothetical protein
LPVLSFLAVAYLKAAKSVKVEQVLYGAWEARDEETNRSPVFDLTPFVSLLDWLTASDRFTRFGNSADLAALVNKTGIYPKDSPLSQAVQVLSDLTQALRLIRPLDAMQISALLPEILDAAKPVAQKVPSLRPYELLVGDLKKAYTPFALANPSVPTNFKASLTKQRDLIRWYVERQQWVQAVSLAREWLITWVIWQMGETDFLNQSLRETVAEIMNKEAQRRREAKEQNLPFHSLFLRNVPGINEVLGNWLALVGIRNDIDHAGMRKKTGKATDLIKSIRTLCKKLDKLPLEQTNLP